jgi:hypothetical protein
MFRRRLITVLAAIAIAVVSSPLAALAMESFLGLGSGLVVSGLAIAVAFTLTARDPLRRAWWFGFMVALGICLPLCPVMEQWLHAGAVYLQRLTQQGILSLSQRAVEPGVVLLIFMVPSLTASLIGILAGRVMRALVRRRAVPAEASPGVHGWRFSLRELLVGLAATCLLLGWISSHARRYRAAEQQNQDLFLEQFEASFTSGETRLLEAPTVDDARQHLPRSPGVAEYRIMAPVEKDGEERWALWSYTGAQHDNRVFLYRYAYVEASSLEELSKIPVPAKRFIEGTWHMIDGVPSTAGPSATVRSVTLPARVDQPITVRCSAPAGTICDLRIFPINAVTTPLTPVKVGKTKTVDITFQVDRRFAGSMLSYELHCVEQRGNAQMDNSTRGNIAIVGPPAQ